MGGWEHDCVHVFEKGIVYWSNFLKQNYAEIKYEARQSPFCYYLITMVSFSISHIKRGMSQTVLSQLSKIKPLLYHSLSLELYSILYSWSMFSFFDEGQGTNFIFIMENDMKIKIEKDSFKFMSTFSNSSDFNIVHNFKILRKIKLLSI